MIKFSKLSPAEQQLIAQKLGTTPAQLKGTPPAAAKPQRQPQTQTPPQRVRWGDLPPEERHFPPWVKRLCKWTARLTVYGFYVWLLLTSPREVAGMLWVLYICSPWLAIIVVLGFVYAIFHPDLD
jgi:hypothetical protein